MTTLPELPDLPDADVTVNHDANLDAIRQEHEAFLTDLEAAAVKALATGDWNDVESCIYFYNAETKTYDV